MSCYFYDAAGERTVKLTSESEMVHVNGKKVGGNANICKFTAYVSPYFVVSNGGAYTKHIYAASQRIASKLGNVDGFGADPRRVEMAGGKKISDIQKDNIGARYKELGFSYSAPEKEKVEKDSTMDSEEPENLVFFYHPDHLGSTSYVTDADGNIAQHVEYIPYGEVFVEERNSQFSTNFLFNAKELDNETGLYYYGARYLDPTGAMWLSVDPVFHAGTSPYAYCLGNPVKMVDPDGRDEKENGQYDKRQTLSEQETGFGSYNNIVGAVFGGASAEPAKGFCSASDLKAAEINIKNAKNGSGLTVESCMGKEGAKYYHMSASASKGVRVVGKAAMGMGVISMGATIGCAVSDVVDHCSSNLSDDDLILSNWTTLMSAAGSIAGGYGGTALGFAAGAETGPGALVTAAIGGYLGAEVGEKIGYGLGYALGKAHIFVRNNQNIINRAFNATKTENSFYFK